MEPRRQWGGGQGELGQEAYKAMERQSSYGEADSGRAATAQSEAYGLIPLRFSSEISRS